LKQDLTIKTDARFTGSVFLSLILMISQQNLAIEYPQAISQLKIMGRAHPANNLFGCCVF
jgi:hypothetical protein